VKFTELADLDQLSHHSSCGPVRKDLCLINLELVSVMGLGVLKVLPSIGSVNGKEQTPPRVTWGVVSREPVRQLSHRVEALAT